MMTFMGENKRLLNIHEQKFAELETFQANTNVFQANTNDSKKSRDTSRAVGLSNVEPVQGCLPKCTKKNPKDCNMVTLRSGRELESRKEVEKKKTEKEEKEETRK